MAAPSFCYSFHPFRLVPSECQLLRDNEPVDLAPKTFDLLVLLVERSGMLVTKEDITRALWPDVAVTDNALTQLVHELRTALEDQPASPVFIETVPRRGYRFIATVERRSAAPPSPHVEQAAMVALPPLGRAGVRDTSNLAAHLAFTEGRLKLERMELAQVDGAVADFERALLLDPRYAMAHVGLAHARFLRFEASRPYPARATADLMAAISEAQNAIDLDPDLPEAHAALALMLTSADRGPEAVAAGRRAVALEPSNWRNHCRLGFAAWGGERVSAWTRVIELFPDFAYAYYGLAMVLIARNDLATAERWLRRGARLQDAGHTAQSRFPGKGLHWLLGFIRLALGDRAQARAEFDRELASGGQDVYAPEFAMNASDGHGFACLFDDDPRGAAAMFVKALEIAPDHPRSWLGLAAARQQLGELAESDAAVDQATRAIDTLRRTGRQAEAEIAVAFRHVVGRRYPAAIQTLDGWLAQSSPGMAGWTIPVEPLLAPCVSEPSFETVLVRLAERAR